MRAVDRETSSVAEINFNVKWIWTEAHWSVLYGTVTGEVELYYQRVHQLIANSKFPGLESGMFMIPTERGWFSVKETTPMFVVRPKNTRVPNLAVYYRAQQFGNVVTYSCIETAAGEAFVGTASERSMRGKFKSRAEWEEFITFHQLAGLVYNKVMAGIDESFVAERVVWNI